MYVPFASVLAVLSPKTTEAPDTPTPLAKSITRPETPMLEGPDGVGCRSQPTMTTTNAAKIAHESSLSRESHARKVSRCQISRAAPMRTFDPCRSGTYLLGMNPALIFLGSDARNRGMEDDTRE